MLVFGQHKMETLHNIEGLYDSTWTLDNGIPKILLFSRDINGNKKIELTEPFYPYFYITEEDFINIKSNPVFRQNCKSFEKVTNKESILDKNLKLIKVAINSPNKVYDVRKLFDKSFEADILFTNRYIIDKVDKTLPGKNKIGYYDIETTSENGFPDYHNPVEPIVCMSLLDNFTNITHQWMWHKELTTKEEKTTKEYGDFIFYSFDSEKDMLDHFLNLIQDISPDYITCWNASFDLNYLVARLERLGLEINKLSPLYKNEIFKKLCNSFIKPVKWLEGKGISSKKTFSNEKDEKYIKIIGTQWFDLLSAYRMVVGHETASWKLDDVANQELGISKTMSGKDVGKVWKNNPLNISEYNYMDVILLKLLDDKIKIFDKYLSLKEVSSLIDINDTLSSGKIIDMYLLKNYSNKYIFPSKKYYDVKDDVAGGFVRTPIAGIYSNVAVLDFSACYPSLIKTFNLSPDCYVNSKIIVNDNTIDEDDTIDGIKDKMYEVNGTQVTFNLNSKKYKGTITIDFNKKGILSETVDNLITLRKTAKKEMKKYEYGTKEYKQMDKLQESFKPVINGIFGVTGFSGFRLYNNAIANSITCFSRMLSKYVGHHLREQGWKVIAGDTDSLFTQLKTNNLDSNLKEINEELIKEVNICINKFIKKFLPEQYCTSSSIGMDCDKIYNKLLLLDVRKRYIGELKYGGGKPVNNILHFMGLDIKRNSTIKISKNAQLNVALSLLHNEDIFSTIRRQYVKVLDSTDIDDFKLPSKLEKSQDEYKSKTPAVKASIWSNEHMNKQYRTNSKFFIIYTKPTKLVNTTLLAFDDITDLDIVNLKIDRDYYIEDVYNKIDNICRGLPDIKRMNDSLYQQFIKKNKSLGEWII